jgi:hypothetical protein
MGRVMSLNLNGKFRVVRAPRHVRSPVDEIVYLSPGAALERKKTLLSYYDPEWPGKKK